MITSKNCRCKPEQIHRKKGGAFINRSATTLKPLTSEVNDN